MTPSPDPSAAFAPPAPGEDPLLAELADVALEAARAAAQVAVDARRSALHVETKSSATDMVSEADRRAESAVAGVVARRRPGDGLLGEEGADRAGTTGVRWIVDPLDGTTNYLFDVPAWSVSVAVERDGRAVVGVVVDPSRDETWTAVAGRGARLNGSPCRVAEGRSELATALVGTGFSYDADRRAWQADVLRTVLPAVRDVRRFGSAALDLCWVGGGRLDAYYEWGLHPWDRAAGMLVCVEAGGHSQVTGDGLVVASTPALAGPMLELLEAAGGLRRPGGASGA